MYVLTVLKFELIVSEQKYPFSLHHTEVIILENVCHFKR